MKSGAFRNEEQGATTLETALTIFPTMLFVVGMLQLSILALNINSLQYALNRAARWGSIGDSLPSMSREQSIETVVKNVADSIALDTSDLTISICPTLDPTCASTGGANNAGGANSYFVIKASKGNPINILGLGSLAVTAQVVIKNEPF